MADDECEPSRNNKKMMLILIGSTNANDAINITFLSVTKDKADQIASFHPEYTELHFGKDQSIFGYKNLTIDLKFAAHDLYPNFSVAYSRKWKTVKDAKAVDIEEILKPDLSAGKHDHG